MPRSSAEPLVVDRGVMRVRGPRGSFLARRRPPGLASSRSWWEAWGHSVNELSRCAPQGCQAARICDQRRQRTISVKGEVGEPVLGIWEALVDADHWWTMQSMGPLTARAATRGSTSA